MGTGMRAAMRSLALLVLARTDALAPPLTIVAESATWIVVDKPSGTPCHSAGADDVLSRLRADGAARACDGSNVSAAFPTFIPIRTPGSCRELYHRHGAQ